MPNVFVIAGPNGAGKTTYARRFLPEEMRTSEFLNADLIAAGLSPFAADAATFTAGRILLQRIHELAARRKDFAFETTLSGRTYVSLLKQLRAAGYNVQLDFLWVQEFTVLENRIKQRVAKGGHDIPESVQHRRFYAGIRNLTLLYRPLLNRWRLFENTGEEPHPVAHEVERALQIDDAVALARIEAAANVRLVPPETPPVVQEPKPSAVDPTMRRSLRALRKAYADAVLENLRFGLPVIVYRDGKVMEVPAEELAPRARQILAVNGEFLPGEKKPVWW